MVDDTIPQERCDFYVYVIFRPDGTPCYVGKGIRSRWVNHLNKSHNERLRRIIQNAKECGLDIPVIKIIGGITNAQACSYEVAWIKALGRDDLGTGPLVNLTDGGEGNFGRVRSKEAIEKHRNSMAGFRHTDVYKLRMSIIQQELCNTPDARAIRSAINKDRIHSEESRKNMKLADRPRALGDDHKRKIGDGVRGIKRSAEFCAKIGARRRGVKASPDTLEKMRLARLGEKQSPETIAKRSASMKLAWASGRHRRLNK